MSVPDHIVAWAKEPGPAKVLAVARARGESGRLGSRARMEVELTADERRQVGRMLGAAWAASGEPIRVSGLRAELARHHTTLEELLVLLGGALRDLRAERREAFEARRDDRGRGLDVLRDLGGDIDGGVLERCLVGADSWAGRAEQIAVVVRYLDARSGAQEPAVRLPVLAASLFRDAHALDRTHGLGRAVARLLAARAADAGGWIDPIGDAAAWHRAWESGGVVCDGVSSQVLVLNLPLTGSGPAASLAAVRGEPVWLTLRALSAQPLTLSDEVPDVFVCENPAIVEAAADRYGTASRPLVCTVGQPNLATMRLLSALAPAATLRVRADGDTVGWGIVERLLRLSGARTWRMPEGFDRYEEEILDELLVDLAPVD